MGSYVRRGDADAGRVEVELPPPPTIGRPGPSEGVSLCRDRATVTRQEIYCEKIRGCSCREATRLLSTRALTSSYSITSSARVSSVGGMLMPSALAVLKFITNSNLVGCSTGRSAGFAPLKILSTKNADLTKLISKINAVV